jgi:hypothetical protein
MELPFLWLVGLYLESSVEVSGNPSILSVQI